ncbi:SCO family protein [Litoreibacter janthinus]|uniref:Protein SCO1/2 n=1 Tax=Litoreibacter janthinus TaxID=670154 RepID=A0A1I6GYH6_9RHOB|nr:SCO family protein [Litoreibacter janthinus]SFR47159.1 protein SCO1/2 [Litoreibacter janthinus]
MKRLAITLLALSAPALADQSPLPFNLGGAFELTDQTGALRTQIDPAGHPQLLFFGYANCREICSAALPMMAQVADAVAEQGITVTPVMITVDPARDTVDTLGPALIQHHTGFVGLTGTPEQLQVAYDAFQIETEEVFFDPEFGPVYAHGSFLYLLDAQGKLLTLVPPVVTPEAAAGIVVKYTQGQS